MLETQAPGVQEHAMHAEFDSEQAIVPTLTVTGIADQMVRDVLQMSTQMCFRCRRSWR